MRSINSFLKAIGLDKVKMDENELEYRLLEPNEDFIEVGRLTRRERRLYAVQVWCTDNAQQMTETSGKIVFCEKEEQEIILKRCQKKYDNRAKLAGLEIICSMFLTIVLHERLNIHAAVNFFICKDFRIYILYNENEVDTGIQSMIWVPTLLDN